MSIVYGMEPEEARQHVKELLAEDTTINLITMMLLADRQMRECRWGSPVWQTIQLAWQWVVEVLEERFDLDDAMTEWAIDCDGLSYTDALLARIPRDRLRDDIDVVG